MGARKRMITQIGDESRFDHGEPDLSIRPMLYNGGAEALCAAVLMAVAIVGYGLIALFHLVFPSSIEVLGALGCVGDLILWGSI